MFFVLRAKKPSHQGDIWTLPLGNFVIRASALLPWVGCQLSRQREEQRLNPGQITLHFAQYKYVSNNYRDSIISHSGDCLPGMGGRQNWVYHEQSKRKLKYVERESSPWSHLAPSQVTTACLWLASYVSKLGRHIIQCHWALVLTNLIELLQI